MLCQLQMNNTNLTVDVEDNPDVIITFMICIFKVCCW